MKIKGMLFIVFAACVGHIGAMEPDKGMQQGTKVPSLKQLALIAKVKNVVQKIYSSGQSQQQAINAFIDAFIDTLIKKRSDWENLVPELREPLLAELGRQYYMLYGIQLDTGAPWGVSIQDYLDSPKLKMPQIKTGFGITLKLSNMKINNLYGLQNIHNIKTVETLFLGNNQLTTIQPNAFAGLTNLEDLRLYNNQLTIIPTNAFAGLPKLELLNLSNNQLTTIQPNAFSGLTNLEDLRLQKNQLTIIPPNAFAGLPNLNYLHLQQNPLNAQTKEAIEKALRGVDVQINF